MTRKHLLFTLALLCSQVSFAQFIGFETEIPKEFTTADKGKIALSTRYYKEGRQSLEWDFRSGSKLNISLEKLLTLDEQMENSYGITLWIYNEVPQQDSIRFEFLSPPRRCVLLVQFPVGIGWLARLLDWLPTHERK